MTNQEIIEGLKNILDYCRYHQDAPALREAIYKLEAQTYVCKGCKHKCCAVNDEPCRSCIEGDSPANYEPIVEE